MSPPTAAAAAKRSTAAPQPRRRASTGASPAPRARPARGAATAPSLPRRRTAPTPVLERLGPLAVGGARRLRDSTTVDRLVRGRTLDRPPVRAADRARGAERVAAQAERGRGPERRVGEEAPRRERRPAGARLPASVGRAHPGSAARDMGLVMPAAADVHYLTADTIRDARQAAQAQDLHAALVGRRHREQHAAGAPRSSVVPAPAPTAAPATGATGATGGRADGRARRHDAHDSRPGRHDRRTACFAAARHRSHGPLTRSATTAPGRVRGARATGRIAPARLVERRIGLLFACFLALLAARDAARALPDHLQGLHAQEPRRDPAGREGRR